MPSSTPRSSHALHGGRAFEGCRAEEGFILLCFGVIGPYYASHFLVVRWFAVVPMPLVLLPSWTCGTHN